MEYVDGWPEGYEQEIADNSEGAYGWQSWRALPRQHVSEWSVGVFHPERDVGLRAYSHAGRIRKYAWRRGESLAVERAGWEVYQPSPPPGEGRSVFGLMPMRSLASVEDRLDLATPIVDHARPDEHRPVAGAVAPPSGSGISHRFEGLPDGLPPRDDVWILRRADGPWSLDIWLEPESADDIERLRFQLERPWDTFYPKTLNEYRFLRTEEVLTVEGLVSPQVPESLADSNDDWRGYETWTPTRAMPLAVTLDSEGRPYDTTVQSAEPATRRSIGTLFAPRGELLVMDGNHIQINPAESTFERIAVRVAPDHVEGDVHQINVDLIEEAGGTDTIGVWLGPHGASVKTWDDLEFAYGTDGGTGGVIAASALPAAQALAAGKYWIEDPDFGARFSFYDLDEGEGHETFTFTNGLGDGGFPLSRGRSANGEVIVVVIWRTNFPWRLAIPEGRPPLIVASREARLLECMAGVRAVTSSGQCEFDEHDW